MSDKQIVPGDGSLIKEEIDEIREKVEAEFFVLRESTVTGEGLATQAVQFRCQKTRDVNERFERLRRNLEKDGFVPFMREADGEVEVLVGRKGREEAAGLTTKHLILFSATILTTLVAGSLLFQVNIIENPFMIWKGWPFSASILSVLGMHELGHYIVSNKRGVLATPPYFIPVPPPFPLGTLGAVIRTKSPMPDKRAMFDIGAAGPLLGLAVAVPVTSIGLYLSPIPVPEGETVWALGRPLIYRALSVMIPVGQGGIHPVAFAGWVGFLVTFLNLLPVGQLDGGHIFRSLFPKKYEQISRTVPFALLSMGFLITFLLNANGGLWIFWGFITMFFHQGGHPPPLNDVRELDRSRKMLGIVVIGLMLACFTPIPFSVVGG